MPGKKHIHKYYRGIINGNTPVWMCALANCSHYMPPHLENLVNNKSTICWGCDNPILMYPRQLEMEKPMCDKCCGVATPEDLNNLSPAMARLLKEKGLM